MSHDQVIRVVSFDVWMTILGINQSFSDLRKDLFFKILDCKSMGIGYEYFSSQFDTMKIETERLSESKGIHIGLQERIDDLCKRLGIVPSGYNLCELEDQQSKLFLNNPAPLISKHILELFSFLHERGVIIAIVSNTGLINGNLVRNVLSFHDLDTYITHYLFSDELGITKPNPLIFKRLLEACGVNANRVLHIGDNLIADYEGASLNGLYSTSTPLTKKGISAIKSYVRHLNNKTGGK
jgi:putative hydrolase of the HAD superfamily